MREGALRWTSACSGPRWSLFPSAARGGEGIGAQSACKAQDTEQRAGPVQKGETHLASAGCSKGGPSFIVSGALYVSRSRGHSLLVAGEQPWGPGSRPAGTPLALTHRSVTVPPSCGGGGMV